LYFKAFDEQRRIRKKIYEEELKQIIDSRFEHPVIKRKIYSRENIAEVLRKKLADFQVRY